MLGDMLVLMAGDNVLERPWHRRTTQLSGDSRLGWLLAMAQQDLPRHVSADLVVGWLAGMLSLHLDIEELSSAGGGLTVFVRTASTVGWTSTFKGQAELRATLLVARASVGAAERVGTDCDPTSTNVDPNLLDSSAPRFVQNRVRPPADRLDQPESAALVEARELVAVLVGLAQSDLEPHGAVVTILLTSGLNTVERFTTFEPQALATALDTALEALE